MYINSYLVRHVVGRGYVQTRACKAKRQLETSLIADYIHVRLDIDAESVMDIVDELSFARKNI